MASVSGGSWFLEVRPTMRVLVLHGLSGQVLKGTAADEHREMERFEKYLLWNQHLSAGRIEEEYGLLSGCGTCTPGWERASHLTLFW